MRIFIIICALLAVSTPAWAFLGFFTKAPESKPALEAPLISPAVAPAYGRLQTLLMEYQDKVDQGGWPNFRPGEKIEPGKSDARIAAIRHILYAQGDLEEDGDSTLYDPILEDAVKRFQLRHGLTDDGVIGKETQFALNVPAEKRLAQIKDTLERMQQFPQEAGDRYIIVNLPEFMLRAYENGDESVVMKTIIGTPKTPTPTFTKNLGYVSFNPHWGVPLKIAAQEMLPKILEDPNYLSANNYAVYEIAPDGSREEIAPETVDWASLSKNHFPYLLRQRPGVENALGKVKFGLLDSNDIYMHDTSAPRLFAKDIRTFSHGCIRVERPYELAQYVFRGKEEFNRERVETLYNDTESKIISVPHIPVHLVYWTAWVDNEGRANFRKDVYGLDR